MNVSKINLVLQSSQVKIMTDHLFREIINHDLKTILAVGPSYFLILPPF